MNKKVVHVSGKRKTAIARATLKPGKGIIKINSKNLEVYEPAQAKLKIKEPLILAEDLAKKVDINITVKGGGWQAQSEAARLTIGKALVEFSESKTLKQKFLDYDRHLLVADVRRKEPNKPNVSKARKKRQFSKR